jgi:hypothetical protein
VYSWRACATGSRTARVARFLADPAAAAAAPACPPGPRPLLGLPALSQDWQWQQRDVWAMERRRATVCASHRRGALRRCRRAGIGNSVGSGQGPPRWYSGGRGRPRRPARSSAWTRALCWSGRGPRRPEAPDPQQQTTEEAASRAGPPQRERGGRCPAGRARAACAGSHVAPLPPRRLERECEDPRYIAVARRAAGPNTQAPTKTVAQALAALSALSSNHGHRRPALRRTRTGRRRTVKGGPPRAAARHPGWERGGRASLTTCSRPGPCSLP